MKKFLKKYKLLIFTILIGIGLVVLLITRKTPTPPPPSEPTPFKLEQTFPNQGKQEIVIPNFAIHFIFSRPIALTNTAVKIEPFTDFEISTDKSGKTLFVMPVPEWQLNTEYKITVSTSSTDGQTLDSPVEYLFEPVPLTTSELEEGVSQ
ncbi:MAG: Ig-like domain-containing protein [Microgenomates group bacterium]